MAFNVKIRFTGICIFVPNTDTGGAVKACVVLPDASYEHQKALDESWLKPHTGFLMFRLRDLSGNSEVASDASILKILKRARLVFNIAGRNEYDRDLTGIPDLDVLTGGHGVLEPSALDSSLSGVAAQVLIPRGILRSGTRDYKWVIPSTLGGPLESPVALGHEILLTFSSVDSFSITVTPFGQSPENWPFAAGPGATIEITIGNLCGVLPCYCSEPRNIPDQDEDFKWHYQLLKDRELLRERLHDSLPLPIPIPVRGQPAGRGANCIPAVAAAAELDRLLSQTKGDVSYGDAKVPELQSC